MWHTFICLCYFVLITPVHKSVSLNIHASTTEYRSWHRCTYLLYYHCLQEYMPLPQSTTELTENNEVPALQFTHIECLMWTFHQLALLSPQFLTDASQTDKLKDFRLRYVAAPVPLWWQRQIEGLQTKVHWNCHTPSLTAQIGLRLRHIEVVLFRHWWHKHCLLYSIIASSSCQ